MDKEYSDLDYAIAYKLRIAQRMIEEGADVNQRFDTYQTPLHIALSVGNMFLVELLLDRGADATAKDRWQETPLLIAAKLLLKDRQKYELCKLLLENGADCNVPDFKHETPLQVLLEHGTLKIVKLLLDHGADIHMVDCSDYSPLHFAACNPNLDVLRYLLDHVLGSDADIDMHDDRGKTPMMYAIQCRLYQTCEFLLSRGVDVNSYSITGWTPLLLALKMTTVHNTTTSDKINEELKIIDLLLESGADMFDDLLDVNALKYASAVYVDDIFMYRLIRHVAKLECQGFSISEPKRRVILQHPIYRDDYKLCAEELKCMNNTLFYENMSLFDLLSDRQEIILKYVRNAKLVEAFESKDYRVTFPIYYDVMKMRFGAAVEKHRLQTDAAKILSEVFQFNDLSHLVNRRIVDYLNNDDMNFLRSCSINSSS